MSDVLPPGWEVGLDPYEFWIRGCCNKSSVEPTLGLEAWMCELIWDKYCKPHGVSRLSLFFGLTWMKHYPRRKLLPRYHPHHIQRRVGVAAAWNHVQLVLKHLSDHMVELSMAHLHHPNNSVPHFPFTLGSWDTFPIFVRHGRGRYQPKYKAPVVKFQGITSHLGFIGFISGPHPGAMSDTTLARLYRPPLGPSDTILADLAYLSVPNCLTPFKKPPTGHDLDVDALEFNRVHQFYRARVEHQFGHLHAWRIISCKYIDRSLGPLKWAVQVLCNIHNMKLAFRCPYMPYTPVAP